YTFPLVNPTSCLTSKLGAIASGTEVCDDDAKGLSSSLQVSLATGSNFEGSPLGENPVSKTCYASMSSTNGSLVSGYAARVPSNPAVFPMTFRSFLGNETCSEIEARGSVSELVTAATSATIKLIQYSDSGEYIGAFVSVD